jgi:predicted Zn-dependent protease
MKRFSMTPIVTIVVLLGMTSLSHADETIVASASVSPAPMTVSQDTLSIPSVTIPIYASKAKTDTLDVTELDQKIAMLEEKAKHYPTRYTDKTERRSAENRVKALVKKLDEYAVHPEASFEILMRAMKVNQMARNLDVGAESALKAGAYMRRAIALKPTDMDANFWYGCMLSEGGGMKEGIPYLNKAAQAGSQKAYVALARAYLSLNKRELALKSLENFGKVTATDSTLAKSLIDDVRSGKADVPW